MASSGHEHFKVQLAYDSPFLLAEIEERDGLRVHSFEDIAAGKLLALYGRAEERDFIDIYCIVRSGKISLERMIELAKEKDPGLDEYYLAIAFEQSEKIPDDPSKLKVNLLTAINPKELIAFLPRKPSISSKSTDLSRFWFDNSQPLSQRYAENCPERR